VRPSYGAVHDFLTNPAYAGAFVFGRTRQEKRLDADGQVRVKTVELPPEQWPVCLPEHHPGYVTWDEYLATRARLRQNTRPRGEGGGAVREGPALLQGLLPCGRCGRRKQVAYSGAGGRSPRYACVRGRDLHGTERACQSLGEAERARRQYDACEPEHRLVARTLERAFEEALAETEREGGKLVALERPRPAPLTGEERVALVRLAHDLPRLWATAKTSDREELLRTRP
jgi:recombinase